MWTTGVQGFDTLPFGGTPKWMVQTSCHLCHSYADSSRCHLKKTLGCNHLQPQTVQTVGTSGTLQVPRQESLCLRGWPATSVWPSRGRSCGWNWLVVSDETISRLGPWSFDKEEFSFLKRFQEMSMVLVWLKNPSWIPPKNMTYYHVRGFGKWWVPLNRPFSSWSFHSKPVFSRWTGHNHHHGWKLQLARSCLVPLREFDLGTSCGCRLWMLPSGNLTWLLKMTIYSGFTH
jgi:hypothetical protein